MAFRKFSTLFTGAALLAASAPSAFAHHPMGGATPSTFMEGLLSGVGHPIIGLDHLAFVVAMGIAAWLAGSRLVLPIVFIFAAIAGTGIHLAALDLPLVEVVIAASVAAIGFILMSGRKVSPAVLGGLFAVAGIFHGYAYGEAIIGAEATPLLAYLGGFGLTQLAIATAAGWVVCEFLRKGEIANMPARLTGGMVAGAGGLLLGQHAVAAMFG